MRGLCLIKPPAKGEELVDKTPSNTGLKQNVSMKMALLGSHV